MAKKDGGVVTKSYLDNHFRIFKTEIKTEFLEIKEEIVKEIKDMREEFDVHQFSHLRINDEITEHDKRIKKLENLQKN